LLNRSNVLWIFFIIIFKEIMKIYEHLFYPNPAIYLLKKRVIIPSNLLFNFLDKKE
jgi:hypothetical protein